MALQQREEIVRLRWWALPFFAVVLVLAVWLALTSSPAWPGWLLTATVVPTLAEQLIPPRHLARRAELLADPPGEQLRPEPTGMCDECGVRPERDHTDRTPVGCGASLGGPGMLLG
ncbi:hypothetical protein [Geodermatophilus sp. SYSU D01176]